MKNLLQKNKWMIYFLTGVVIALFVGCPNVSAQSFQVSGFVKDQRGGTVDRGECT